MTEIAFHFNAADRLDYLCRLLRKAVLAGAKVGVVGPAAALSQLDAQLWAFSAPDFVPHCLQDSPSEVLAASPVVLTTSAQGLAHQQVLVNLGQEVAAGFEGFERVIEVVGLEEAQRQAARARWRHYTELGYAITRHDLVPKTLGQNPA